MKFKYTTNAATLYVIPCGMSDAVHVVGDPDMAAYEYVIVRSGVEREHSDCAYGSPEVALRDGLIEYTEYGK